MIKCKYMYIQIKLNVEIYHSDVNIIILFTYKLSNGFRNNCPELLYTLYLIVFRVPAFDSRNNLDFNILFSFKNHVINNVICRLP